MTIEEQKIEVFRGDTKTFTVIAQDCAKQPFPVTGFIAKFTVKAKKKDTDENAIIGPITGTIVDGPNGVILFSLSYAHTDVPEGTYLFDVQINKGAEEIYTIAIGKFIVTQDITIGD